MTRTGPRRLGVALGGGAARGLAHVGALKALDRYQVSVTGLSGTSYGSVIAALYALGAPALEIERVVRTQDVAEVWRQALDFGWHRGGAVSGRRLSSWLDRKFFLGATFDDLSVPLAVACTDLSSGRLVVITSGRVADAVMASCALPGVFAPVPRGDRLLVDGGLVETVPFRALATVASDPMVGVHAGVDVSRAWFVGRLRRYAASPGGRDLYRRSAGWRLGSAAARLLRGMAVSARSYSRPVRAPRGAELVSVDPGVAWWDFHRSPTAIDAGERAMTLTLQRLGWTESATGPSEPGGASPGRPGHGAPRSARAAARE